MNCSNSNGAPNLSLNLDPATKAAPPGIQKIPSSNRRPKSSQHAKAHNIVKKDYYRLMKSEKNVEKHLKKKKEAEFGRAPLKTSLDIKNARFKSVGEVISEQYTRANIPESRLYIIDKVVRMRGQHGRFGIDHSELLNYELEQTNKPRDDHMNWLVAGYDQGNSPPKQEFPNQEDLSEA